MIGSAGSINGLPILPRVAVALLIASTVCVSAAWLATYLLRKRSAALRCQVWLAAFFSIFVLAAVQLSGFVLRVPVLQPAPAATFPAIPKGAFTEASAPPVSSASAKPSHASPAPSLPRSITQETPSRTGAWIVQLWVLGVGVGFIRIVGGLIRLAACARSSIRLAANSNVERLALELRHARNEVRLHPSVHSPISFGWPRAWVILPVQAIEWSEERLKIVLRHEQAHAERWDFLFTLLVRMVAAVCWPNPLVWLGLRRFRALCEDATDDRVVTSTDATAYAEELFRLLRDLRLPSREYGLALSVAHGSSTRGRIARLLDRWTDRVAPTRRQTILVLTGALAAAASLGALRFVRADSLGSAAVQSKDETAWTQKLDAYRVPTPLPTNAKELEASGQVQASQEVWEKYWAKEHPRLWKLAEAEREFLRRFPSSAQAPVIGQEMISSSLRCLDAKDPLGKQALAWVNETLAQPDLSAQVALPLYSYQANMIGILSGGGNIDSLAPVPRDNRDIPDALDDLVAKFAKRFPNTPELGSLYLDASYFVERDDRAKALAYLDQAQNLVKDEKMRSRLDGARFRLTAVSKPVPALSFTALDGSGVDLASLKGKVVLLDFWATWCAPCVKELPRLQALQARWQNKGLQIIGISVDSSREALAAFIRKNNMPWPQSFDEKGWEGEASRRFGVTSIPSTWIIDQHGIIAAVNPEDPAAVVERLLGSEQATAGSVSAEPTSRENRQKTKGVVTVHVVDADGKPVTDTWIHRCVWTKERFEPNADYRTDAAGIVRCTLPNSMSILRLWASKDACVPLFANWQVEAANNVTFPDEVTFVLKKGADIGGFVLDEKGAPIQGAKVEVSVRGTSEKYSTNNDTGRVVVNSTLAYRDTAPITDARGFWSLNNTPDGEDAHFNVTLSHPDFLSDPMLGKSYQAAQGVTDAQFRARTARIVMARGVPVEGAVTDPSGKPIEKAVVIWGDDPYFDSRDQTQEVRTDLNGKYHLSPRPLGPLTLTVTAPGWSPAQKDILVTTAVAPVDFSLKPGKSLQIRFTDEAGQPIPEVAVSLETWHHKRALYNIRHPNVMNTQIPNRADKNGIYTWTWAPEDEVKYTFWKNGYKTIQNQILLPGEHQITLSK